MDAFWDAIQFSIGWLAAGFIAYFGRAIWKWIKRTASATLLWAAKLLAWVIGIKVAIKVLRSIGNTLKIAKTPEQRAYVVASAYAILLKHAADVAKRPGTPKDVVQSLKEVVMLVDPLIDEYVDAVRFKSS